MVAELVKWFQFHEGPIKTFSYVLSVSYCLCFNSMKVRLKPFVVFSLSIFQSSFNSMKVRLKRILLAQIFGLFLFQFHEGPIKTVRRPKGGEA